MTRNGNGHCVLSTGRVLKPYCGVLGLLEDYGEVRLTEGFDRESPNDPSKYVIESDPEYYTPLLLTSAERREIAERS